MTVFSDGPRLLLKCLCLCSTLAVSSLVQAADTRWQDRFCVEAQQVLAGTSLEAQLQVHQEMEPFVESKATDSPFTVHQFLSNPAPGSNTPRTLSCKMRTAERINTANPTTSGSPAASGDSDCIAVHRRLVVNVLADIPPQERMIDADAIVYDEDNTTYIGPRWLSPWPFDAVTRSESGTLHLRARALYAPHAWWIPMPARFKGNYYCHLVAPDYLETLLRGTGATGS